VATELGKALADKGHQVHFVTYSQPARLDFFSENLYYHEVSVSKYPLFDFPPYELALASKLVDVVRFEKLDVLHVHYAIPHASAAFLAKQILATFGIHIPFITTLHGTDITIVGNDVTYKPVVNFSINNSDGVTAVSEHLRNETFSHFEIQNEIRVIQNFIDLKRFSMKSKDHFKKAIAPNNERILVHTSNFRKVKRASDVIRIFKIVSGILPSKLLMVGDGEDRVNCEQLCRELGICDHVRFLGKQDAVEEILSVADLFVMPSESESFGLAALEAMACSVPVLSSNAGGLPELNIDGLTGFMGDVGAVEYMAEKAVHILGDDLRLANFKENALKRAKAFELSRILPQYEAYYEEVVARSAALA
jgi:N-acetyl-alpha-D-glucosaminyl L-malate synthase BshA